MYRNGPGLFILSFIMILTLFACGGNVTETDESLAEATIEGVGDFTFDPDAVSTLRSDIFQEGHFSVFDVLVHLDGLENLGLEYHFDQSLNTHVITAMNDESHWWYNVHYDGGWDEFSVFRMDLYPYKDRMTITFTQRYADRIEDIHDVYASEVRRLDANDGILIIPKVILDGEVYEDVEVTPHHLRDDVFKDGVITAIDVVKSLGGEGTIDYELKWYDSIGRAEVVQSYWVHSLNGRSSEGRAGFVYESGDERFHRFSGNHIHLPSDTRVITSPGYLEYFWIDLTSPFSGLDEE